MLFSRRVVLAECYADMKITALSVLGAAFMSTFGVGSFTFALSLKAADSGISASWLGLAFSGYFLARLVLAPLAGYGADYLGALPLLRGACAVGSLVPFLYYFFPQIECLGVVQICLGFCGGVIKPVSMSLLGDCVPPSGRGRLFGAYNTCLYTAFVAAPLAGGASSSMPGGLGMFPLIWPVLGMGVSFILFMRPVAGAVPRATAERAVGERLPWGDPGFSALLLAVLGRTAGAAVVVAFLPRLITEQFHLGGLPAGLLFALPNLVIILCMPATSRWADTRNRAGLTFLGMGLCAGCLYGLGQTADLWALCGLVMLLGLGSALSLPASMSLVADMGKASGRVMGVFLGASNLGFVFGPGLAGFAAEAGGMTDAFELTALFSSFCLLPVFAVMSRRMPVQ